MRSENNFFVSDYRVSHLSPGSFPHPAAADHLPGPGLRPAGNPQPRPAGGAVPQPLGSPGVRQLQLGQVAGRPAGQRVDHQQSPAGRDERLSGQGHGLPGQQHAPQLAGGSLLPADGAVRLGVGSGAGRGARGDGVSVIPEAAADSGLKSFNSVILPHELIPAKHIFVLKFFSTLITK